MNLIFASKLSKQCKLYFVERCNKLAARSFCALGNNDVEEIYKSEIADVWNLYKYREKIRFAVVGKVVSTKCAKSITVQIKRFKYHPKYNGQYIFKFIPLYKFHQALP